ncbi:MAG: DMT family transporter [Candidatus Limnocylindria bacterium]
MRQPSRDVGPIPSAIVETAAPLDAPPPTLGVVIVLGSAAMFGMLGPLSRFSYEAGLAPASFVVWRAAIGLCGLGLLIAWRARTRGIPVIRPWRLPQRVAATLFLASLMGFTLNVGMFFAFDRITVALALLGFYTYPAIVAVIGVALGRERLDAARAVALLLAVGGMVLVVAAQLDGPDALRFDALGFGLALGAAASQTVYVLISRDGYRQVPVEQALALALLVTVVGGTVLAVALGAGASLAFPFQAPDILPLLLFTGIFAAAIPSIGFLSGVRSVGGVRAGTLMLFEPVVGVVLAAWLLGEALRPIQVVGGAAILVAAMILQRTARTRPPDATVAAARGAM